jgi:hypothetical protein
MSAVIECPSGLQVQIRGLKGKEGRLLGDKQAIRQGTVLETMLQACTEQVVDPGPYAITPGKAFDWSEALIGDRFYAFLQIRLLSFGAQYIFKIQCKDDLCRKQFEQQIDLEKDLEITRLSDEDREVFRTGGTFTTSLRDGRDVRYRLPTGADEKKASRSRASNSALVDMLTLRIVSIEGVGESGSDIKNSNVRTFLEELDWSELVGLLNALDEHDCGVKTDIEIECPECGGVQEVPLPFARGFLLPGQGETRM